jgi:hypothetical protein
MFVGIRMSETVTFTRVNLKLIRFAVLDEQVDQLGRVLHEVNILVHGAVHDQQPALLIGQLAGEVEY